MLFHQWFWPKPFIIFLNIIFNFLLFWINHLLSRFKFIISLKMLLNLRFFLNLRKCAFQKWSYSGIIIFNLLFFLLKWLQKSFFLASWYKWSLNLRSFYLFRLFHNLFFIFNKLFLIIILWLITIIFIRNILNFLLLKILRYRFIWWFIFLVNFIKNVLYEFLH